MTAQPVYRFAPSPNGRLHLGHAYSALLNEKRAREGGGRLLVRIEDIDTVRCREDLVAACLDDLAWLGLSFEVPVLRQSTQFGRYRGALDGLSTRGLIYGCTCSRGDIARAVSARERDSGQPWPRDPDGAPLYPGTCRGRHVQKSGRAPHALRLNSEAAHALAGSASLTWQEAEQGRVAAEPARWGDVILARKDVPTSYHLSVVLDDAMQGVTHVVRGRDLFEATAIHRLLQHLLGLPEPAYEHHDLLVDGAGHKLAKSRASTPLLALREAGASPAGIRAQLGFA